MREFAALLTKHGLASAHFRGCTFIEIRDLESYFGLRLPERYKEFLQTMGKSAGQFMVGTDMFYKSLFNNREALEEVLGLDAHPFPLKKEMFVFSSHQGYIFHFFDTSLGIDDPPVYGYAEGDLEVRAIDKDFSTYLTRLLRDHVGEASPE
jgi:hypothetical protein